MNKYIREFLIKSKLFAPIGIAITVSIVIITIFSINNSKEIIYNLQEKNLILNVEILKKIIEKENINIDSEKGIEQLKTIFKNFKINSSESICLLDRNGNIIVNQTGKEKNWKRNEFTNTIIEKKRGQFRNEKTKEEIEHIIVFDYIDNLGLYIVASISQNDETSKLVNDTIKQSILFGIIVFVILSLFVFFVTSKKIHGYLKELEESDKKLLSTKEALEHSENKFQTLFNSSSDEVFVIDYNGNFIEFNKGLCESLEYTREELLQLRFIDIKTKKFKQYVNGNLKKIIKEGQYTFETEHLSKSGKKIQFEIKGKTIDYERQKVILCIGRNISDRKALEKKIVQTIIETEMKERKRFSSDLHDGLGPILSTIKLYSDLIKKGNHKKMSLQEAVTNIDELVELAISSTKEISNNITPNVLYDFGLKVAINEFCSYINQTQSVTIDVDSKNYTLEKDTIETTVLYQAVKELINNTIKHAQASNIRIQLKNTNNQIILYYRDDGVGFNLEEKIKSGNGLGLSNIFNKIKTLKGSCDFNTSEGKGMFIVICINIEDHGY